ncbi:restriction endonuclease subunit S [Acinetobacter baumannii]|uniref:restriction endonuclease subunit S n=1 Tax=Acinetobacter baumannii TaxID=470 RepID=UPI0008105163|nr:restriction endonuclease subunit S [Acinetobacter baumannii]
MEKQKCPEVRFKGFTLEWEEFKLENMFTFYRGESFSKSDIVKDGNFKCIHYGELFTKYNSVIDEVLSSTNIKGLNFGRIGDILMPSSDVTPDGLAKASCLKVDNVLLGGDINILRPVSLISSVFISYQINHSKEKILKCVTGTTVKHVYNKDLKELGYLITAFKEQTQIGNFFQNLDQSIALHEKKLAQTQNLKKAMLEKMFPKAGSKQPEIRLKGFSGDWHVQCIGDFTRVGSGARVHKEEWTSSGVPFFRSSDVVSSYKGNDNSKAYISFSLFEKLIQISGRLEKDDLLITGGGSIGIPYLVQNDEPLYSKDADLIWIKKSSKFNSQYLYTFFSTSYFRSFIASISHIGTIAHYTIEQVKATPVCLPSIEEQVQIGNFFKQLDGTLVLQKQQLQTLKNLKQAFLEKMFV